MAGLRLENKEDIDWLYDMCVGQENECVDIVVEFVYDPIVFIRSGFFPMMQNFSFLGFKDVLLTYLRGMRIDAIEYWYGKHHAEEIQKMNEFKYWSFCKMSYYENEGLAKGGSVGLILYGQTYKSLRPITDMSMFRGPNGIQIKQSSIIDGKVKLDDKIWHVVPVTRYSSGMSRGLYYEHPVNISYCGTFYYSEPESKTVLAYETSITCFNKTDAVNKLKIPANNPELIDARELISDEKHELLISHINGQLPGDLKMTPVQWESYMNNITPNGEPYIDEDHILKLPQDKVYVGKFIELYAAEDSYDQVICKAAQKQNIDIIILTHMIGSHQIVTEILDTRNRTDSFKSLLYIID